MKTNGIFHKTSKGKAEITSRANGLSLQQRRVLILVNGAHDSAELARLSLCDNVDDILQTLAPGGFINGGNSTTTAVMAQDYAET